MEVNSSESNNSDLESKNSPDSSTQLIKEDILDDSVIYSKALFRKLAKKYHKLLDHSPTDEELVELIKTDLITKRQNSLLLKEYFKAKFWREVGILLFSSLCVTIVFDYFVSATGKTGIFPAGLGAIARLLATISFENNPSKVASFFFVFQFALNIPFIIFGICKLGMKFTIATVLYMGFQILFDQTLQVIPVINPNSFHFIVDVKFMKMLDNSWNYTIWLFIIGILGGAMLGWGYANIYRIGGSTGGTDFITVWFSKKNSKPLGSINRNINLIILTIVLIANVIIMDTKELNKDLLVRVVNDMGWDGKLRDGQTICEFIYGKNSDHPETITLLSKLQQLIITEPGRFNTLIDSLPTKYIALIKMQFVMGPSLFGSITLIVIQGISTNFFYPKYKLRTFLISTNNPQDINQKIIDMGFQNEIASWDTTNRSRGNYLHRTMFMISMPVMQWHELQRELFIVDPYIKITVLRTKSVIGLFKYEPVQNRERDVALQKVTSDQNEIEKIKQVAIVKFKKEMDEVNDKRKKLYEDIKAGGNLKKRAEREITKSNKKRQEMINKFKEDMNDIKKMND